MNYSIIIPHKNVPELLEQLLNTIPRREDTEIIIVDDHSDIELVDFDHFPGVNRPRTHCVFLDQSKGAGYARNIGLEKASGRWLLFADADDSYTDCMADIMNKYALDESIDMVILNARMVDEFGNYSRLNVNKYIDNFKKHRLYSNKVIRYGMWTPWSRMVKREMICKHNLRFEEVPTGNDMMFCLLCSKYAKNIVAEQEIVYNYLKPIGRSLTNAYSKQIESLEPKVDRTFRRLALYKEVNYIFKPDHIHTRFHALRDPELGKEYFELYNDLLRKHHYSNLKDVWYFLLTQFGRLLDII